MILTIVWFFFTILNNHNITNDRYYQVTAYRSRPFLISNAIKQHYQFNDISGQVFFKHSRITKITDKSISNLAEKKFSSKFRIMLLAKVFCTKVCHVYYLELLCILDNTPMIFRRRKIFFHNNLIR